jgi:hypothetical protein
MVLTVAHGFLLWKMSSLKKAASWSGPLDVKGPSVLALRRVRLVALVRAETLATAELSGSSASWCTG